jgi:hypothetical protein
MDLIDLRPYDVCNYHRYIIKAENTITLVSTVSYWSEIERHTIKLREYERTLAAMLIIIVGAAD